MNSWIDIKIREPQKWSAFTRQCLDLLDAVRELDGTDKGTVQLFNPNLNALQIVVHRGFELPFLQLFELVRADDLSAACGRALRYGQRIILPDIDDDLLYRPYRSIAKASGYCAVQSTPIPGPDRSILGVFSTYSARPHSWSHECQTEFDNYAAQMGQLIVDLQ